MAAVLAACIAQAPRSLARDDSPSAGPVSAGPVSAGPVSDDHNAWVYHPPRMPALPEVDAKDWPRSDLDYFVLAELEKRDLRPAGDADRHTLIRRACLALIGLPPSVDDLNAFLEDDRPDAWPRLVDRLLASPRFGERWGRHWLDIARYAESTGGGRSQLLREAWRYRNYVIHSFDADKPYDVFLSEQIAGDLLPFHSDAQRAEQLIATGFLALGPKNLDNQDKELLRMDVVDEQIDTVGQALLGMALGCARCHDHKFDPIPTRDYYALAGVFRSTKTLLPGNVSGFVETVLPSDASLVAAHAAHKKRGSELRDLIRVKRSELKNLQGTHLAGILVDDVDARLVGNWTPSTFNKNYVGERYLHDANEGKGAKSATFTPELPKAGRYEVFLSYTSGNNRDTKVPVLVRYAGEGGSKEKMVHVNQRQPGPIGGHYRSLGQFEFQAGRHGSVEVSNGTTSQHVIVDAVRFVPVGARGAEGSTEAANTDRHRSFASIQAELKALESEEATHKKNAPPPLPRAISVSEEKAPDDCALRLQGNAHALGEKIPRGFLSAVQIVGTVRVNSSQSGRKELAAWLVQPDHPLTARVYVNRVWHHLFGRGIVASLDNFGVTGERPSHPELLDWISIRFVQGSWSTKELIRELMISRTYRMSSDVDASHRERDPENRWLSSMPRRRLDVEVLRDMMLAFSGELWLARAESTIRPGSSTEFGYTFATTPGPRRRSVYLPVFRNTLPALHEVFDFANPNLVTGQRNTSVLPSQSLFLMNSDFVLTRSRLAAERLLSSSVSAEERIRVAYRELLSRDPSKEEFEIVNAFLFESAADVNAWSVFCQSLMASIDFRYSR